MNKVFWYVNQVLKFWLVVWTNQVVLTSMHHSRHRENVVQLCCHHKDLTDSTEAYKSEPGQKIINQGAKKPELTCTSADRNLTQASLKGLEGRSGQPTWT